MRLRGISILAALVAVIAFAGVANASAAVPTFNIEAGHSFPQTFTVSSSKPVIESVKGTVITCESVTGEGKIVESGEGKEYSGSVSKVVLTYHKCTHNVLGGGACSNNSEKNAVVSASLKGTIGYVEPGVSKAVGLQLEGEAEHGAEEPLYASFSCTMLGTPETFTIRGHLIGELGSTATYGTYQAGDTLVYKQSKGVQQAYKFSGVANQLYLTDPVETNAKLGIGSEPTLAFEGAKTRIQAGSLTFVTVGAHMLPQSFTTSMSTAPVIETSNGFTISCKSESGSGEIVESGEGSKHSNTVAKVAITYHNCTTTMLGGGVCSNNSEKNAVVSESLRGVLGYVNPGVSNAVGLALEGEAEHGAAEPAYVKLTCAGSSMTIKGRLVGLVGEKIYNKAVASDTLSYTQSSGTQEALKIPGVTNQLRISYGLTSENLGIAETPTITFGGNEMEIEA